MNASKKLFAVACLAGILCATGGAAQAQQETQLKLKTVAEKEITARKDGKTVIERVPLAKASPGDVIVYSITYLNIGKTDAVDATIIDPIPQGAVYIMGSAAGNNAEVTGSIDDGRSWQKPPIMVQVKKPDGQVETKAAPPGRYTHLRWVIKKPVLPGQSGLVSLKVSVK